MHHFLPPDENWEVYGNPGIIWNFPFLAIFRLLLMAIWRDEKTIANLGLAPATDG